MTEKQLYKVRTRSTNQSQETQTVSDSMYAVSSAKELFALILKDGDYEHTSADGYALLISIEHQSEVITPK